MRGGTGARRVLVVGECATEDLRALDEAGFTVEIVASAADAFEKLQSNAYHAVLARAPDESHAEEYSVVADVSRLLPDSGETFFTAPAAKWQAALLNDLAENTEAGLVFLDRDFNFVWVNSAYCRKCGYARDELIGRSHFELFPDAENKAIFEQVRDTGVPYRVRAKPFVFQHQPERGVTYWNWTLTPIRDETGEVGGLVWSLMDVTEEIRARKHTEKLAERLAEGRRFLSLILDNVASAVTYVDHGRVFRQCNSAAAELLGLPVDNILGRRLQDVLARSPGIWESVEAVLRTGTPRRSEMVSTPAAGEQGAVERHFLVSHVPDIDATGRIRGVFTAARDVTELLDVQKQLDADRAKLHAIVDNMREGLVVVDTSGRLIDWNRSALEMHGFERIDEAPGDLHSFGETFTMTDQDGRPVSIEECPFSRVASGETLHDVVLRVRRANTQAERVVSYGGSLVRDRAGDPILAFVTLHDITEEYRAGEELRQARLEAESRALELESIISSMADGVALFDSNGRVVWANEVGRWMLEIREDEPPEQRVLRLDWRDMEDRRIDPGQDMVKRLLRGEILRDAQYRLTTAAGRSMAVSVSGAPLRGPDGSITRAIAVLRDMTERAELDRARDELYRREHRIAQMLQQALVPPEISYSPPGCLVAVRYEPGSSEAEIGGDFYDVFEVSEGKVGLVIGDVAGKGLPAAIQVAAARYAIRSYAYLDLSPGAVMAFVNKALCSEGLDEAAGMLTAFFVVVDVSQRTIVYANGGHEPPLLQSADGSVSELRCDGIALGVTTSIPYREVTRRLQPGDRILMFTDGITEARSGGEMYGNERVAEFLARSRELSCEEVASRLMESAKAHAGGRLQDDAAVLVLELPRETNGDQAS